jgi:hypothetical protein
VGQKKNPLKQGIVNCIDLFCGQFLSSPVFGGVEAALPSTLLLRSNLEPDGHTVDGDLSEATGQEVAPILFQT